MFKYRPNHNANVDEIFCLLCTSVIASIQGYNADEDKTELIKQTSIESQFYRAYYILVAGDYDSTAKATVNHLTLQDFNTKYYDTTQRAFDKKNGVDAFASCSSIDRFMYIFKMQLLPTVRNSVGQKLLQSDLTADEIDAYYKKFRSNFEFEFKNTLNEMMVLNTTTESLWVSLYKMAVDMPHVVIGLRKQLSSYNHKFFEENKTNLQDLKEYMKSVKLKFDGYVTGFSIAGIIINEFSMHHIDRWFGIYGGTISGGSSVYVDSDGALLFMSDLQNKMHSNSYVHEIDSFNTYMKAIDTGSDLYTVAKARYFNIIEWRQNKCKKEIIESLNKTELKSKLKDINLEIGGYLTELDISGNMGNANGDKRIRFQRLDEMLTEAYNTNIKGITAQSMIDKWTANGDKAKRNGEAENGSYPMNFKYKENKYTYNKKKFKELIKGVSALKALEAELYQMGETIMSFPVYGRYGAPHELILGVSLSDYLNQENILDTEVEIESDIVADEKLGESIIIDNVSAKATELGRIITREHIHNKIQLGSLTDEELALTIDNDADREMLLFMKSKGFSLTLNSGKNGTISVKDMTHTTLSDIMKDSRNTFCMPISEFCKRWESSKGRFTGVIFSKIRYLTWVVKSIAVFGLLTHSIKVSSNTDMSFKLDNDNDILLEMCISDNVSKGLKNQNVIKRAMGEDCSRERYSLYSKDLQYRMYIGNKLGSIRIGGGYLWNGNRMSNDISIFKGIPASLHAFIVGYFNKYLNSSYTVVDFMEVIIDFIAGFMVKAANIRYDRNRSYNFQRYICFTLNMYVVTEMMLAALECIEKNIPKVEFDSSDINSDDTINIRLLISNIKALEKLTVPSNMSDKYKKLKMYEDIYSAFFNSVPDGYGTINRNTGSQRFSRFVFMDSIHILDPSINDTEERLFQYEEITKYVHMFLTECNFYGFSYNSNNKSILEYLTLVNSVLDLNQKHSDDEYFINNVIMMALDTDTQSSIEKKLYQFIESCRNNSDNEFDYDEDNSWFDNLLQYCNNNKLKIGKSILEYMQLNLSDYTITDGNLIALNNKIVYSIISDSQVSYKVVLTRYGIFKYDGVRISKVLRMEDFKWLL